MVFNEVIFTTAVLDIAFSSPAVAHKIKNPAAPQSPIDPPSLVYRVDLADLLSMASPFQTFLKLPAKDQSGITIFVPKDSAFASLKKNTLARLTKDQIKSLLLYHTLRKFYSLPELSKLSRRNLVAIFAGSRYTLNLTDDIGSITVMSVRSNTKMINALYARAPVAVYEVDKVFLPMQIFKSQPTLMMAPGWD
ncbi:hypothetical protein SETIT_6G202100v2 [Setaria italica]|uniref:FAS1 domain-containing protein n=1 Tax=Setaria italica TaxID=4555 RepID=K3YKY6_SETIT|nr:hypothetical protein SETIT_6G202100v2 [Setaria italica]